MGEMLKKAYEDAETNKSNNEYKKLAALLTKVYTENLKIKQKLELISEQNLKLINENIKLKGLK